MVVKSNWWGYGVSCYFNFSVYLKISYKVMENINKENKISATSSKMISPFLKCRFFFFFFSFYSAHSLFVTCNQTISSLKMKTEFCTCFYIVCDKLSLRDVYISQRSILCFSVRLPGSKCQFHLLLSMWLQAIYLTLMAQW